MKQQSYISKQEASSPTVMTEAVFLTALVDAHKERDVAIIDIAGAIVYADMDELVHVTIKGKMAEMLLEINPTLYGPCMTYVNGKSIIYTELLKALYGTFRVARLFWENSQNNSNMGIHTQPI